MKTEEAKEKIIEFLKEKDSITAQEINYQSKGTIPFVQIYSIMSGFVKAGGVKLNEVDGKKSYSLLDEGKLEITEEEKKVVEKKREPLKEQEKEAEQKQQKGKYEKPGRDLTRYKFNGSEYNKGRLALAIITQYAKDKRPSLKSALELFPDELVPPYGVIKPIKDAKEMSKERQRFFIKPEEQVKFRDGSIAVSNQFTKDRIEALISIAKKQLGYSIK